MRVTQLIYRSHTSPLLTKEQLKDILAQSQHNNMKRNLTGVLCLDGECFIQLLEGPHDTINDLFQKLVADERHRDFELILYAHNRERIFEKWAMLALGQDQRTMKILEISAGGKGIRPQNMQPDKIPQFIQRVAENCLDEPT